MMLLPGLLVLLALSEGAAAERRPPSAVPAPEPIPTDREVQVSPQPPRGALELGLLSRSPAGPTYAAALRLLRDGRGRDALALLRVARAQAYRAYDESRGGAPERRGLFRHFIRLTYAEELVAELTERDRQLQRLRDHLSQEERLLMQQERAVLLHRELLLWRGAFGQLDRRLLQRASAAYELVLGQPGPLRAAVTAGYAALLATLGDRRAAVSAFAGLSLEEQQAERLDLQVAAYWLALGDRARALSRLRAAARRDGWDRGNATQDGRSLRQLVYRMSEFDDLREHPGFLDLVSDPEDSER